jgi:hypothetical protein
MMLITILHKWKYRFDPLYRIAYDSEHARQLGLLIEYQENEFLYGRKFAESKLEEALSANALPTDPDKDKP